MKYYHGSNADYDFPSIEVIQSATEDSDVAAKAVVGYYVTPMRDFAERIGKYVYEIVLKEDAVVEDLTLSNMVSIYERENALLEWDDQAKNYKKLRLEYLAKGVDMVSIIEHNGTSGESFIVNLDAIATFTKL